MCNWNWAMAYILLVIVLPALFGWYVLPKLIDWNDVKWAGLPEGWVYK